MPTEPPVELIQTLSRLELATPEQVRRAAPRVRRLARDLPLFESVWIDALSQARVLTPFQAAEINAGRADRLRIGALVLCQKLSGNGLGELFVARDTAARTWWRLMRVKCMDRPVEKVADELETLLTEIGHLNTPGLFPPRRTGIVEGEVWAACQYVDGMGAADWLARHGRMPPEAVLEIARQMLPPLIALESHGRGHGDLGARQLILCGNTIALPLPGVRGIVRPAEGYSHADLPPEAFDGLAPERVLEGSAPTVSSDLFALGCLWWHLLTGRAPLAGGDALSKLRAAHAARIADVRSIAPDAPAALAEAIVACTQADPAKRPPSMQILASRLGEPSRPGKAALARCLTRSPSPRLTRRPRRRVAPAAQQRLPPASWLAAAAMACLAVIYIFSGRQRDLPLTSIAGQPSSTMIAIDPSPTGAASSDPNALNHRSTAPKDDTSEARPPELLLSARQSLLLSQLDLSPGLTVRGRPGERPLLMTPSGGLVIDCEDVTFENIDFISQTPGADDAAGAILQLRAYRTTLRGCSFQSSAGGDHAVAAIAWSKPPASGRPVQLPTGTIKLVDCAFGNVTAAIECRLPAALRLELVNCLHLGPGPLVRRAAVPRADEPCRLSLEHCTLRQSAGVLSLNCDAAVATPGDIEVRAMDCALLPAEGSGLLEFAGSTDPAGLVRSIQWTGQGSLLGVDTPVAMWRQTGYEPRPIPEDYLYVSGLVRSRVEFAGRADAGPEASRLVRWQAPLLSPDPPGITEQTLFLPAQPK